MKISQGSKAFLLFLTLYSAVAYSTPAEATPVVVEAAGVTRGNGHIALNIRFWNCANKSITVNSGLLPWGQMTTGLIVYKGAGLGKELHASYPVSDPVLRDVAIDAGGYVVGALNLDVTFTELESAKHLEDLVVFWVYDAKVTGIPSAGKFGGMLPLLKTLSAADGNASPCR
ncbi:hypothetical protein DyAD56_18690 [Dyella sp. AD56]|uniref:hypothetical protein n=1 Tax=Dyella sp. AD56 TaxID=1528744 RepID=UPI000C8480AA|nr:hypothetical protein [Dyella sp. AD56]PMQ03734.1 hypothetical protein DyAD56_18690 [Dyella sp. AD56]